MEKGTNISQADLFKNVDKNKLKRTQKQEPVKTDEELLTEASAMVVAPDDYAPVKFCTLGKLGAPKVLHFRNYTLEEAAELADLSTKNQYEVFARILNSLVYEDFDCSQLHKQEVLEVLLTIYATWWSPILETLPYFKDEKLEGEKLRAPENRGIARIRIAGEKADIEMIDLKGEFKSPFKIVGPKGEKLKVRFPQIGDLILAKNYTEAKYAEQEKEFYPISKKLSAGEDVDPEELSAYQDYLSERGKEGLLVERSCLLIEEDGEVLDDATRLAIARTKPLPFWSYIAGLQKDYTFGINPKIKFYDEDKRPVERRFEFRFIDWFPSMDKNADSGYTVSFD